MARIVTHQLNLTVPPTIVELVARLSRERGLSKAKLIGTLVEDEARIRFGDPVREKARQ